MRGWCCRCSRPVEDVFAHVIAVHDDEIERWPDGEIVVDDIELLDPEDFL